MRGYYVVGSDGKRLGEVVGAIGDYLIVGRGRLLRTRRALPVVFAHVDDAARIVRVTVSKAILADAPKLRGDELDEEAVAAHYGI